MFSLMLAWTNFWINHSGCCDLRHLNAHVSPMWQFHKQFFYHIIQTLRKTWCLLMKYFQPFTIVDDPNDAKGQGITNHSIGWVSTEYSFASTSRVMQRIYTYRYVDQMQHPSGIASTDFSSKFSDAHIRFMFNSHANTLRVVDHNGFNVEDDDPFQEDLSMNIFDPCKHLCKNCAPDLDISI